MYNNEAEYATVDFTNSIRKCLEKINVVGIKMKDCGFIHAPRSGRIYAYGTSLPRSLPYPSSSSHTKVSISSWDTALLGTQKMGAEFQE
jgi:hypothetical protein